MGGAGFHGVLTLIYGASAMLQMRLLIFFRRAAVEVHPRGRGRWAGKVEVHPLRQTASKINVNPLPKIGPSRGHGTPPPSPRPQM